MSNLVDFKSGKVEALARRLGLDVRFDGSRYVVIDTIVNAPVLIAGSKDEVLSFMKKLPLPKDAAPL